MFDDGRKLWHYNTTKVERKRYFEPITMTAALAGLTAAAGTAGVGAGIGNMFGLFGGKKKSRDVPDPLASLRLQLQNLAGQVPAQVARQKEINAANATQAKTTGMQGIAENIRAERGFGNTSLQDRLNTELADKLYRAENEANLNADIWGTGEQARILGGTASMYPSETQLPQEPSWGANLLGAGAQMAVQNWQQEQGWKQLAEYLKLGGGGGMGGSSITTLRS